MPPWDRDTVHALTFSNDGRFLATGGTCAKRLGLHVRLLTLMTGDDWSVMLWDLEQGARIAVFQGHQ
jgi:WD40 repeat protein